MENYTQTFKKSFKTLAVIFTISLICFIGAIIALIGAYTSLNKHFEAYQDSVKKSDTHGSIEYLKREREDLFQEISDDRDRYNNINKITDSLWWDGITKDSIIFADIPFYKNLYTKLKPTGLIDNLKGNYYPLDYDSVAKKPFWIYCYKTGIIKSLKIR